MPKYFSMNSKDYKKYSLQELLKNVPEAKREDPKLLQMLRRMSSEKIQCSKFPGTHVRATPLVEVLGVMITKHVFALTDKSLKISGTIQATDAGGCETIVDLFNRGDEDPESICLDGLLSLTMSKSDDDLIFPSHDTKLEVDLKDTSQGENIEIAHGAIDISLKALDDSEGVRVGFVKGKYGCAAVLYATLYSAVLAKVDVKLLFKKNQDDSTCGQIGCDLYGSIIAQYYKCGSLNNTFDKNVLGKCLSRILFDKSRHQSEHVVHGGHIGLCNSIVAVPAYSSLVIEFDLVNADTGLNIVQDRVEIQADNMWSFKKDVEGRDCVVQLIVSWCLPDTLKRNMAGGKQKSSPEEQTRSQQLPPQLPTFPRNIFISQRMEVFSIFIGHNSYKNLSVYGRIVVYTLSGSCSIFKRDKNRPQHLSPSSRTISIRGSHEAFDGYHVGMDVDLKDINGGLTIKGCFNWCNIMLEAGKKPWYNEKICSGIQGKGGYAVIHYTIFSDAVEARVRVSIVSKDSSHVYYPEVYGTLVAQYNCFNYSTSYETKYYRTTLYDEPPGNGLELYGHQRLPLLKPAFAVPVESPLIIDADLYVGSSQGLLLGERNNSLNETTPNVEHIRGSQEFKYDGFDRSCKFILGQYYDIRLTIIWMYVGDD